MKLFPCAQDQQDLTFDLNSCSDITKCKNMILTLNAVSIHYTYHHKCTWCPIKQVITLEFLTIPAINMHASLIGRIQLQNLCIALRLDLSLLCCYDLYYSVFCNVLWCSILHCSVLCCTCSVLYSSGLCCVIMFWVVHECSLYSFLIF